MNGNRLVVVLACSLVLLLVAIVLAVLFRPERATLGKLDGPALSKTVIAPIMRTAVSEKDSPRQEPIPLTQNDAQKGALITDRRHLVEAGSASTEPIDLSEGEEESMIPDLAPGIGPVNRISDEPGDGSPVPGLMRFTKFKCTVLHERQPVRGAYVHAELLQGGPDGTATLVGLRVDLVSGAQSDDNGIVEGVLGHPDGASMQSAVVVIAYHPDVGLGRGKYVLEDLVSLAPNELVLELQSDGAVTGVVIDADGVPRANAIVTLSMSSTSGVNLSGLRGMTREDGTFEIRGLSFGNTPISAHAKCSGRLLQGARTVSEASSSPGGVIGEHLEGRKTISHESFDPLTKVWDVGEIPLVAGGLVKFAGKAYAKE